MTPLPTGHEGDVSPFALDVYFSAGRTGDPALEAHVAGCERCQAYLASLDAMAALPAPIAAPPSSRARRRPRWPLPLAGALAFAAAGALFLRSARERPYEPDRYVGIKGTPAVQVLVHRGGDTRIWDGRSSVRPGDSLALRVACEGLERVAVAAPGTGGWTRLTAAECASQAEALPFTLRVDGEPGAERLAVVLSQAPLDDDALKRAIAEGRRAPDVWVVSFVMPKETEEDR